MSSKKVITEQTAFETAGIPTPPDQENIAATDMISEAVEEMIDHLEHSFEGKPDKHSY
ncbi:hypothetical protein [Paenibacillus contaminans]|uniref:hypothetical protein n=1 Tax=Paenibacillus contaminans TaxID=450362 RepID=UPI0018645967|nr:hypothetical protein [Paenibacillus contaminans]